jgi:hypothetical protein
VDESTLAVHKVELVVKTRPGLSDGGGVGKHGDGSLDGSKTTSLSRSRDSHGLLVVDSELETSGAPLNKVERGLGLEGGDGGIAVARNTITTVQKSDSHVLAVSRITDDHLVVGLKALEGKLLNLEALVLALVGRNDRSVADKRVVDSRVGNQVSLELVEIDVESTVKSERRGNGADNLGDETVQVLVWGSRNIEVATADIVDSLVVDKESTVGVLNGAVSRQDSVVRLNNGSRCSGSRVDSELELGLLAVLGGETLEEESTETRTSTTTERVEDQETLERLAVVGDTTNSVHDIVDHLLANGVVTTSVVVGGILLTTDQKLGVEQVTVFASSDLIDRRGVEIDEQRSRNILSAVGLGKEGLERTGVTNIGSIGVRSTIGAEAVLEKVELPSRVTELGTGLTQVEVKNLALHLV